MSKLAEYFNPIGVDSYLADQHIDRYRFALKHVKPHDKVLDIACGSGYGTMMLRSAGSNVIGGDYDAELIPEICRLWNYDGFIHADALNLPFEDDQFDVVISFETIEHVVEGQRFISEMRRVLKPGGIFICSTPNIDYTAHPWYHVKEYKPEEFFRLMEANFAKVERFGQYFKRRDRLNDLFTWHLKAHLVPVVRLGCRVNSGFKEAVSFLTGIAKLFCKKVLHLRRPKWLRIKESVPALVASPRSLDREIEDLCSNPESHTYGVQKYKGPRRVRIMVTKAVKDDNQ